MILGIENCGNEVSLRCSGKIVYGEDVSPLFEAVAGQQNGRIVVLDLTAVSRIDACGLGILVFLGQWARAAGVQLQLLPSKPVLDMLELTLLSSEFEIRSPEDVLPESILC